MGRHDPEGRRGDDAQPQMGLQERRQRGRGDRGRHPHPEVLQGHQDRGRHRQRLLLRPRLLAVVPGGAQALRPRREVRARALPQARRHRFHVAHRGHPAVEGRSAHVLVLVRRRDDHHEAGGGGRPLQDDEGRLHDRRRRPRLVEEGVHAGGAAARLQHDVLRRPQGEPPAQAVRPGVQGEVQRVSALRVRPRVLQRRVLQGGGGEGRRRRQEVAGEGSGRQGARRPRDRVALRQAQLARGPRPDVQLLSGDHHAQERLRLRDHQPDRDRLHQAGDEAGWLEALRLDQRLESLTTHVVNVLLSGLFHAAVLFLVAAGLQVVFGVQKIFNLACGSFYALGAYVGVSAVGWYVGAGGPPALFIAPLAVAGLAVGAVGGPVERGLLRFVYDRDEPFQLLLTFALVLMMEAAIRMTWGTSPRSTSGLYLTYGRVGVLGTTVPVYNLIVIGASLAIAVLIGWVLTRTASGWIIRATPAHREMAEAPG